MNRFYHKKSYGYRHHEYARNRHSQDIFPVGRNRQHGNYREGHFNFDKSSDASSETNETSEPVTSMAPKPLPRKEGK